jgi:hypothetical protein
MGSNAVFQCRCSICGSEQVHPDRILHRNLNLVLSRLDEQQRRWLVALEAQKLGHGGDKRLSEITGLHPDTIRRGREELDAELDSRPADRIRNPGAGRPPVKKKIPRSSRR